MATRKKKTTYARRKENRVWIPGVPAEELLCSVWHFDGMPSALQSLFRFKGTDEKFLDDISFMAIIGQPFRFWFAPDWASCLAYTFEQSPAVIAADVLGFNYEWEPGGYGDIEPEKVWAREKTLDKETAQKRWELVKEELDEGNPVVIFGGDEKGDEKAGPLVLTGFDEEKRSAFYIPHATWAPAPGWDKNDPACSEGIKSQGYRIRKEPDETNWYGNGYAPGQGMGKSALSFFVLKDRVTEPTDHEVALAVIKRAVDLGRGRLRDTHNLQRRSGLPALDLLAECLDKDGETFEYKNISMPWDTIGETDWWFAMEGIGSPLFPKTASLFLERCASGLGSFSEEQRILLFAAAGFYVAAADHFGALWDLFLSTGPLDTKEDRVAAVNVLLGDRENRKRAAEIVRHIRRALEKAISFLERTIVLEMDK